MPARRPTRIDVAMAANVAPSTVSLVLSGRGNELRIPARTQDRIKEAARSLGYYPNAHISAVLHGRSGALGVYLRSDQWSRPAGYWTTMLWQLQRVASAKDVRLLLHNAQEGCSTEDAFARQAGGAVDGVIILNSCEDPIAGRLLEVGLPAVEIGDAFSDLPFVGIDGASGVKMVVEHLKEMGYKSPVYLSHLTHYTANAEGRIQAFRDGLRDLFNLDSHDRVRQVVCPEEEFTDLRAFTAGVDVLVCGSDELAYGVLRACAEQGVSVPTELAVVGFDALDAFGSTRTMTSVKTPLEQAATEGVEKLLAIIEGRPYEKQTLLPVELRIGDTT